MIFAAEQVRCWQTSVQKYYSGMTFTTVSAEQVRCWQTSVQKYYSGMTFTTVSTFPGCFNTFGLSVSVCVYFILFYFWWGVGVRLRGLCD